MNLDIYKFDDHERRRRPDLPHPLPIQDVVAAPRYVPFLRNAASSRLAGVPQPRSTAARFNWNDGLRRRSSPCTAGSCRCTAHLYATWPTTSRATTTTSRKLEITQVRLRREHDRQASEDAFSKDDIREKHPLISDSTINRTLKRMQEEEQDPPARQRPQRQMDQAVQEGTEARRV
ncbi:MAG: hypothetical protein MZU97_11825 [Bacillus subtilis]|nr:hypothetical protein [Bacillus subtilis]